MKHLSRAKEMLKGALFLLCVYGTTDYAQAQENVALSNRLAGNKHIYLTHLSLYMTIATLVLSYLVKHFGMARVRELYRDALCLALPIEGLVTTAFWTLNYIDPMLLKNRDLYLAGVRTPLVGELSIHLLPLVLLLADQIGVDIQEQRRHYWIFASASILYFVIIYHFQRLNNCWLYPFLDNMSMALRVASVAALTIAVVVYYKVFLRLSQIINTAALRMSPKLKLI